MDSPLNVSTMKHKVKETHHPHSFQHWNILLSPFCSLRDFTSSIWSQGMFWAFSYKWQTNWLIPQAEHDLLLNCLHPHNNDNHNNNNNDILLLTATSRSIMFLVRACNHIKLDSGLTIPCSLNNLCCVPFYIFPSVRQSHWQAHRQTNTAEEM